MGLRGDATGAATSKKLTGPYCRAVAGDKEKEGEICVERCEIADGTIAISDRPAGASG
jgi:hypothetical protein